MWYRGVRRRAGGGGRKRQGARGSPATVGGGERRSTVGCGAAAAVEDWVGGGAAAVELPAVNGRRRMRRRLRQRGSGSVRGGDRRSRGGHWAIGYAPGSGRQGPTGGLSTTPRTRAGRCWNENRADRPGLCAAEPTEGRSKGGKLQKSNLKSVVPTPFRVFPVVAHVRGSAVGQPGDRAGATRRLLPPIGCGQRTRETHPQAPSPISAQRLRTAPTQLVHAA